MVIAPIHTENIFNKRTLKHIVAATKETISNNPVDAIAGMGHSGLILGSIVAYELDLPFIAVRKMNNETKNDINPLNVYSMTPIRKYAIVDDLISSGDTMERIIYQIQKLMHIDQPEYIVLYQTSPKARSVFRNIPCFCLYKKLGKYAQPRRTGI